MGNRPAGSRDQRDSVEIRRRFVSRDERPIGHREGGRLYARGDDLTAERADWLRGVDRDVIASTVKHQEMRELECTGLLLSVMICTLCIKPNISRPATKQFRKFS